MLMGLALAGSLSGALAPAAAAPTAANPGTARLERSWQELDQQLRALDALIPPAAVPLRPGNARTPLLPEALLVPNRQPAGPLNPSQAIPPAPLSLPTAAQLQQGRIAALGLEQALAIAFANNASLQARRLEVAAALADLQAALGRYWPRLTAFAAGSSGQSSLYANAPKGNTNLGLGANFAPGAALAVPSGGAAYLRSSASAGAVGLELDYALIDFVRTPLIQAVRARLAEARQRYANQLRQLQLQVSEAYYLLQQADQTVRIQDAAVRNDLLILQDALDLKRAGLVPRLDVLRRRAIEASDQEALIQALADRAIARRQLAVLLNLPAALTPAASDPILPMPRWPLDLDASLLAAYRGNPELEALLAAREALAHQRDATAAALLPRLTLFASGGSYGNNTNQFNIGVSNGGCCGSTVIPVVNNSGYDWSLGLSLRWLLFDAGSTGSEVRALTRRAEATAEDYAAQRDAIRLRLESAFFNHEASLARLSAARRGVAAALEAFRDSKLRYQSGLSSEVELSITQDQLIQSLVKRLKATVAVNITYARLLRELLPMPRDPAANPGPRLQWPGAPAISSSP